MTLPGMLLIRSCASRQHAVQMRAAVLLACLPAAAAAACLAAAGLPATAAAAICPPAAAAAAVAAAAAAAAAALPVQSQPLALGSGSQTGRRREAGDRRAGVGSPGSARSLRWMHRTAPACTRACLRVACYALSNYSRRVGFPHVFCKGKVDQGGHTGCGVWQYTECVCFCRCACLHSQSSCVCARLPVGFKGLS